MGINSLFLEFVPYYMGFTLFRQEINLKFSLSALTGAVFLGYIGNQGGDWMISPSLWMIIEYLLTAPLSAVLTTCILHHRYGVLKNRQILTACVLGVGMLVSIVKGLDAVLSMFPLFAPLYLFSLWCSGYFAVECVKKRVAGELRTGDVLWAIGTYFGFMAVVFFVTPVIRWCEGCMEWH